MNRNSDIQKRFPNFYNQFVLQGCLSEMKPRPNMRQVARKLGMNNRTVRRVFNGTATQKQVWPIARFFKVDWMKLHDLTIPPTEYRRAVLNGGSRSVR